MKEIKDTVLAVPHTQTIISHFMPEQHDNKTHNHNRKEHARSPTTVQNDNVHRDMTKKPPAT